MKKLVIMFWKLVSVFYNVRPKLHLPKYKDFPLASCDIAETYIFPERIKILYEWDEKGRHWIVFTRETTNFTYGEL